MIFDTHTHSKYSADSSAEPQEMLQAALRSGLAGLCVTDHFDCDRIPGFCTLENLRAAKRAFDPRNAAPIDRRVNDLDAVIFVCFHNVLQFVSRETQLGLAAWNVSRETFTPQAARRSRRRMCRFSP